MSQNNKNILRLPSSKLLLYVLIAYLVSFEFISHDAEKVIIFCLLVVLVSIFIFAADLISTFLDERAKRIQQEFDKLYEEKIALLKSLLNYHSSIHNFHNTINDIYSFLENRLINIKSKREKLLTQLLLFVVRDELKVLVAEQNDILRKIHINKLNKAFYLFNSLLKAEDLKIAHITKNANGSLTVSKENSEKIADLWNASYGITLNKSFFELTAENNTSDSTTLTYLNKLTAVRNQMNNISLLFLSSKTYSKMRFGILLAQHLNVNPVVFLYFFLFKNIR